MRELLTLLIAASTIGILLHAIDEAPQEATSDLPSADGIQGEIRQLQADETSDSPSADGSQSEIQKLRADVDALRARVERLERFARPPRVEHKRLPDVTHHRFRALYFSQGPTTIGDFTIDGPVASTLRPLHGHLSKIAVDPERDRVYGRGHHDVYVVEEFEKPRLIEQDPAIEEMSWLSAIAWDPRRDRLLASTFAGGGCLYEYYPEQERWSVVARPGLGVSAFVHAETEDKLYGVNLVNGTEPITTLYEFNVNGARVAQRELSHPIETAEGYGPVQLVWLDGWLFLIQSHPGPPRGYLIEPETGTIHRMSILQPHEPRAGR